MSYEEIRECLYDGVGENYSHMMMVCDRWDYSDFPVYVERTEDINDVVEQYSTPSYRIMEIYSYDMDLETQLNEVRAMHIEVDTELKTEMTMIKR